MTHYLLSVHIPTDEAPRQPSDEEMQRSQERIGRLEAEMTEAGALVLSGRLDRPETATVVRESNGQVLVTDGPFVEAKEQIGGFYIIEAADHEAAHEWAGKTSAAISMPIEVRPFWGLRSA